MKKIVITKIMNNYEVVLNVGKKDGINENQHFAVLGESNPIYDLETGELLGTIPYVKVELKVKKLYDNLTVCEDSENGTRFNLFNIGLNNQSMEVVHNKLNVDIDDLTESEVEQTLKIGDLVEIID